MQNGCYQRGRLQSVFVYGMRLTASVVIAMFCFCPVGAYLPRERRNPAAKIGIPAMVIKDKVWSFQKLIKHRELVEN